MTPPRFCVGAPESPEVHEKVTAEKRQERGAKDGAVVGRQVSRRLQKGSLKRVAGRGDEVRASLGGPEFLEFVARARSWRARREPGHGSWWGEGGAGGFRTSSAPAVCASCGRDAPRRMTYDFGGDHALSIVNLLESRPWHT